MRPAPSRRSHILRQPSHPGPSCPGQKPSIPGILSALAPAQPARRRRAPPSHRPRSRPSRRRPLSRPCAAIDRPAVGAASRQGPSVRDSAVREPAVAALSRRSRSRRQVRPRHRSRREGRRPGGRRRAGSRRGGRRRSWHDVRALTSARRNPDAQRHAAADGHCVTGRGAWHIRAVSAPGGTATPGNGAAAPEGSSPQGNAATHAGSSAPRRQRGGFSARRCSGSRYRRCDVDELREPVDLLAPPTPTSAAPVRVRRLFRAPAERPGELPVAGRAMEPSRATAAYVNRDGHRARRSRGSGRRGVCPGLGVAGASAAVRGARAGAATAAATAQPTRRRAARTRRSWGAAGSPVWSRPPRSGTRHHCRRPSRPHFRQGQGASRPCRTTAPRRRWPGGDRWQLLAACDRLQCHADHMHSPVNGERLGKVN